METLESRRLLSTSSSDPIITPNLVTVTADYGGSTSGTSVTNPRPVSSALTPSQIAAAYKLNTSSTSGLGQTIAIVDAYNDPNIQGDLAAFDSQYNISAANLTVVNQYGQTGNLPATDPNWSLEIALDVEWAHAAAPGAKIVLVEANSASINDLMSAVQTASGMASVVSMSWGGSEFRGETAYDTAAFFAKPGVTFVAASGDDGGAARAEWPAVSPYVVSVGGTTLSVNSAGATQSETAWSASGSRWSGYSGSTGGASLYESAPSYQVAALGTSVIKRATPDVSADANPNTGLSVYDSVAGAGQTGWFQVGGTSAGSPLWAGIIAAADQARAAVGKASLSSSQTLTMLYGMYKTSAYSSSFHDITSGANFVATARAGYDMVTGLGSPVASSLVASAATFTGVSSNVVRSATSQTVVASPTQRTAHTEVASATPTSSAATTSQTPATLVTMAGAPAAATPASSLVVSSTVATAVSDSTISQPALPAQAIPPASGISFRSGSDGETGGSSIDDPLGQSTTGVDSPTTVPVLESLRAPANPAAAPNPLWDAAVGDLMEEQLELPAIEITPAPTPLEAPEASTTTSAAALAGLAIAAFSTWRYRASRNDHSRRQASSGYEPSIA